MNNLPLLTDRVDALVNECDNRYQNLEALNAMRALEFRVFTGRGFWARLRWLVWGS